MKKILSLLTIILTTTAISFAADVASSKKVTAPSEDCRFRANEWQVDASVVGASGLFGGDPGGSMGGNLGINYFFTKYFGVDLDNSINGYQSTTTIKGSDRLQADLIARYPIYSWNVAPYAMVGGGASWDSTTQGNGNVGVGLEYRFTHNIGLFADCRWLYGSSNAGALSMVMPRAGVRFVF